MRPTFSIILFTVLSGTGYGLWFLFGLGVAAQFPLCEASAPFHELGVRLRLCASLGGNDYALPIGFILVSAGLLFSLGHLGQPRRAWRAFSQWRSSWLSREGVASIVTYIPAAALGLFPVAAFFKVIEDPATIERAVQWERELGALLSLGALVTVYCTANIYASLKPIRAWHNRYVVPIYLMLSLYSGALCFWALMTLPWAVFSFARERQASVLLLGLIVLAVLCALLKHFYWRDIDDSPSLGAGRATGLDAQGSVRSFEQPHTEENYLTREMGFVLARKHASKLRAITLLFGFAIPALLAVASLLVPQLQVASAWLALAFGLVGILVERWLFFAEARHAVMAYYGR